MLLSRCMSPLSCGVSTISANDASGKTRRLTMNLCHSGGVEISPQCQLLHFHARSAMEDPFPPPLSIIPRHHSPLPPPARFGVSEPHLPSISTTKFNSNDIVAPQPASQWPYLSVTAPQPSLHNAQPALNPRVPSFFSRHCAPSSVLSRHGA